MNGSWWYLLTTVVFKPSWFKVEWWADIEDVRVSAIAEMRDTEFGSGRREGVESGDEGGGGGGHGLQTGT